MVHSLSIQYLSSASNVKTSRQQKIYINFVTNFFALKGFKLLVKLLFVVCIIKNKLLSLYWAFNQKAKHSYLCSMPATTRIPDDIFFQYSIFNICMTLYVTAKVVWNFLSLQVWNFLLLQVWHLTSCKILYDTLLHFASMTQNLWHKKYGQFVKRVDRHKQR